MIDLVMKGHRWADFILVEWMLTIYSRISFRTLEMTMTLIFLRDSVLEAWEEKKEDYLKVSEVGLEVGLMIHFSLIVALEEDSAILVVKVLLVVVAL